MFLNLRTIIIVGVLLFSLPFIVHAGYDYAGYRWGGSYPQVSVDTRGLAITAWRTAANDAMASWNGAGAKFGFYSSDSSSNETGYYYENSNVLAYAKTFRKYVIAGDIVRAEVFVNNFHNYNPPYSSGIWYDLRTVLRHEIGHWLRLNHSDLTGAVMYKSIPNNTVKQLSNDDIAGIRYIYGTR